MAVLSRNDGTSTEKKAVQTLYEGLIGAWNRRNAGEFAAPFMEEGNVIGFDGSQLDRRPEIAATLAQIFAHHPTPPFVSKIREIRFLSPDVALLRAVVGMVPPGSSDIDPQLNAVQSLVAEKRDGQWRIALFQNTPAQWHGRPELVEALTDELRQVLRQGQTFP